MKIIFSLILSLVICAKVAAQPAIEEIVENHLETTGITNLEKELTGFAIEGTFQQNKMDLPIKIKAKKPGKLRMDMEFNKLNFVKISNGNKNWEYNPMSDSVITHEEKKPVFQDFVTRWMGLLFLYPKGKLKVEFMGEELVEDLSTYKLEVEHDGNVRICYLDKLSFLILRVDDDLEGQKVTYYRDYRKVGKYFVPFTMVGYEGGVPAISMRFSSVKFNPALSNDLFDKPQRIP